MKKTLALALVAAMTISMASMTAFASVTYTDDTSPTDFKDAKATVTLTDEEMATRYPGDFVWIDGKLYHVDENKEDRKGAEVAAAETQDSSAADAGITKTYEDTLTLGFEGWADLTLTRDDAANGKGKWTAADVPTVTKPYTTDEELAEHQKAMEEKKKADEKAKSESDKLQKLDEKYGANIKDDATNGFDENTGKAIDVTAKADRVKKGADGKSGMGDFYTHAINIAGAPDDDGKKTWTYDVNKTAGKLGDGNTVRVEFDLSIEGDTDLSRFEWKVYHIVGWCKAEKVKNVEVVGNKLYAWVDSCSPYVVTRGDVNGASAGAKDASNPSTGDFSAVPVALLAAAALGATGFVAYKKRKAE